MFYEISTEEAKVKCLEWGWKEPPAEIVEIASFHVHVQKLGLKTIDVMLQLKLISEDIAEQVKAKSGDNLAYETAERLFESAATVVKGGRQKLNDQKNRVLAPTLNIMYLPEIDNTDVVVHPIMNENKVMEACIKLDAVVVLIQDVTPAIVFGRLDDSFKSFIRMGRQKQEVDPIYQALRAEKALDVRGGEDVVPVSMAEDVLIIATSRADVVVSGRKRSGANTSEAMSVYKLTVAYLKSHAEKHLQLLGNIFEYATSENASNIDFAPKEDAQEVEIVFRIHQIGYRARVDLLPTMAEYQQIKRFLTTKMGAVESAGTVLQLPQDGYIILVDQKNERYNIRGNFIPDGNPFSFEENLVNISLRLLPHETGPVDLEEKKVNPKVMKFLRRNARFSKGLNFVVGPTGSGKSTTLFGMVELHRQYYGYEKIRISLEDPIERDAPGIKQIQISRAAIEKAVQNKSNNAYSVYEPHILRHDPNLILMGEIRDPQSAIAATSASATGHYLLSTMHSDNTETALERLLSMVPPEFKQMVIENLNMIIGQRLVPELCRCKKVREATDEEREEYHYWFSKIGQLHLVETLKLTLAYINKSGCELCRGRGVIGVIPVYEILDITPEQKRALLLSDGKDTSAIRAGRSFTMQDQLIELVNGQCVDVSAFLE